MNERKGGAFFLFGFDFDYLSPRSSSRPRLRRPLRCTLTWTVAVKAANQIEVCVKRDTMLVPQNSVMLWV